MKATLRVLVLLAWFVAVAGCQQTVKPDTSRQVNKEADAIAVVLADIRRNGGDPDREECSARKTDEGWWVTAWYIFYPTNVGSSRFASGGFTDYLVNKDGRIVKKIPGL